MDKRLWLGLLFADLSQLDSLADWIVNFALSPARLQQGLAAPSPGEGDDFLFVDAGSTPSGIPIREMRAHRPIEGAAHFRPVINGLLLFRWLFPGSSFLPANELLGVPGYGFLQDAQRMAYRTHEEIRYMAGGLLGIPMAAPFFHGIEAYGQEANERAMAELRAAQELIVQAVGAPEDFGDYRRLDIGLAALDFEVADRIDTILRRDVHERLIWLGTFEESDPGNESSVITPADLITFDRGVFAAVIPESITGLVAMDFAESLRLDRAAGRCQHCGDVMLLSPQQAARARRGECVFHPACHAEHRLEYYRSYHAKAGGRQR